MKFDRKTYFNYVRDALFLGEMEQSQVDGQDAILTVWETYRADQDPRFLAYVLATTYHETSQEMQPIEEYGKGVGMEYGEVDPETGQTYYGRGFVQLTWRDNYARADKEILASFGFNPDCEAVADNALDPKIAAAVMFLGMEQGWFRGDSNGRQTLYRYFNDEIDDAYQAREIINGDKTKVPDWSHGVSIGNLIRGYHEEFLEALARASAEAVPEPSSEPLAISVAIEAPEGVSVRISLNGRGVT